jgi:hypothetical protein
MSVPLGNMSPGPYECQVTVLRPGRLNAAFWRGAILIVP